MTAASLLILGLLGAARTSAALSPGVSAQPPAPPSFAHDVAPLFDKWCISCHGEKEAQGGLRLDSYEAVLKGGDDGPVLVPGDADNSQLLGQIERRARPAMPPKKRLPKDGVATIRAWIISGAGP